MSKERIIQLRAAINEQVFLHERLGQVHPAARGGDAAVQPRNRLARALAVRAGRARRGPRRLAARHHLLGRLAKVWALLVARRTEVYPEDIQDLAPYILGHRIWLGRTRPATDDDRGVIRDVVERVAIP